MPSPNFLPFSTLTWYANCTQLLAVSWTRTNLSSLHAPAWISGGPSVTAPPPPTQNILGNIWRHPDCRGSGGATDRSLQQRRTQPQISKVPGLRNPTLLPFLPLCGRNCSLFTVSILYFHFLLIIKPPKFSWTAFPSFPCKCRPVCS